MASSNLRSLLPKVVRASEPPRCVGRSSSSSFCRGCSQDTAIQAVLLCLGKPPVETTTLSTRAVFAGGAEGGVRKRLAIRAGSLGIHTRADPAVRDSHATSSQHATTSIHKRPRPQAANSGCHERSIAADVCSVCLITALHKRYESRELLRDFRERGARGADELVVRRH